MIKIGDDVIVVNDHDIWIGGEVPNNSIFRVVDDSDANEYFDFDNLTVEYEVLKIWPNDFKLVKSEPGGFCGGFVPEPAKLNFGSGLDREVVTSLVLNDNSPSTFEFTTGENGQTYISGLGAGFTTLPFPAPGAIGIPPQEVVQLPATPDMGVYRPNLEDRKVGKVRVELVDDGFPLALREIAKVMTWAQTAKGYKDHDWQNLPNAEQALGAATSRHRTDNIIQRQVGKSEAIDCVDHESKLLHKAHEAFGVLAQLELILRGEIK